MKSEQIIIPVIMAEGETETVEAVQPQDGLQSAYAEGQNAGLSETPRRRERREESQTASTEDSANEPDKPREHITVRRSPTLQESHDGTAPEEVELPDSLARFSADAISAAMNVLGLNENDLQDERWQILLEQRLEEEAAANSEEEGDEADPETEEQDEVEKKEDATKPEEQQAPPPLPKSLEDLANSPDGPAKLKELNEHVTAIYERSKVSNEPLMLDIFAKGLAATLQTPTESLPQLRETVEQMAYAGQALVESAVPKMLPQLGVITQENFASMLEMAIPGLQESFRQASVDNTWAATMEQEEFKGLNLAKLHTPEFGEAMQECCDKNPWFLNFIPTGPGGERLPNLEALRVKMAIGARLMAGQRITPAKIAAQVSAALATGKRGAERSTRRVSTNRMLGKGRTTGAMGQEERTTSLRDAYNAEHGRGNEGI